MVVIWILLFILGVGIIVWGAETFAEHLGAASVRLGVSAFALALLLAGAEPEELATVVAAALHHAPGIALGDVVGANVAICLVALGVGAVIAPLPFRAQVMRYALLGLPLGAIAAAVAWDGRVGRLEGALLVALYVGYVAAIWATERRPPALGEVGEIEEARQAAAKGSKGRIGRELALIFAGVVAMAIGASLLVESVQRITNVESTQTTLGLTLVGFATAFELVVLAWSAWRSRWCRRLLCLQRHHDVGGWRACKAPDHRRCRCPARPLAGNGSSPRPRLRPRCSKSSPRTASGNRAACHLPSLRRRGCLDLGSRSSTAGRAGWPCRRATGTAWQ